MEIINPIFLLLGEDESITNWSSRPDDGLHRDYGNAVRYIDGNTSSEILI